MGAVQESQTTSHCLVEFCVSKKPLEACIFLLQLLEVFGLGGFHPAIQLLPAVIGRGWHLQSAADIGHALALIEELLSSAQLADDLLGSMALAFHGAAPGQVWPVG